MPSFPKYPALLAPLRVLAALPATRGLASALFSRCLASVLARHPGLLVRLGPAAGQRFLLDAPDLPDLLLLQPGAGRISVHARKGPPPAHDAAITGTLPAFLAMLHGEIDGDALFFSGELTLSGDTAAVLALRNALDDAEIDLTEEIAALAHAPQRPAHRLSAWIGPRIGLSLQRREGRPA